MYWYIIIIVPVQCQSSWKRSFFKFKIKANRQSSISTSGKNLSSMSEPKLKPSMVMLSEDSLWWDNEITAINFLFVQAQGYVAGYYRTLPYLTGSSYVMWGAKGCSQRTLTVNCYPLRPRNLSCSSWVSTKVPNNVRWKKWIHAVSKGYLGDKALIHRRELFMAV